MVGEGSVSDDDGARVYKRKTRRELNRPASDVLAYVLELSNIPKWNPTIVGVDASARGKARQGTRVGATVRILGVEMRSDTEVVEVNERQRRAIIRVQFPRGGSIMGRFHVEDAGGRSVVHYEQDVRVPKWVFDQGVTDESIIKAIDESTESGLSRLETIVDGGLESTIDKLTQELSS